jgi:aerobic carbon-monoxide dehydrogenase medium subunit
MYAFNYVKPASLGDAAAALGSNGRFVAGGQSLIQAMKLRLSSADNLVDLSSVKDLKGIKVDGNSVTIGAMTTHAEVASSKELQAAIPGLAELAGGIGDRMVRNRGTIGGSLANADPAACYPAAVLGLMSKIITNKRTIDGDAFFKGLYETALAPDELITAVSFSKAQRSAYIKFKQPASRFAMVGVFVSQGTDGVRVGVTGAKSSAFRATEIEKALSASFTADAATSVKMASTDINSDLHASAEYRAAMISVMASRAVAKALAR